jgi:hypothetical protein
VISVNFAWQKNKNDQSKAPEKINQQIIKTISDKIYHDILSVNLRNGGIYFSQMLIKIYSSE